MMGEAGKSEEEIKFEDALKRLEQIVARLEEGELELEQSVQLFEEGVTMAKRCHARLEQAEKRMEKLVRDKDGGLATEPMENADDAPF